MTSDSIAAVRVSPRAQFVLADNPTMMTLDGTNTWILREPTGSRSVVVDPGPNFAAHLDAVEEAAGEVALVLYTHHHPDHTEAIDEFARRTGAPARAIGPYWCRNAEPLRHREVITVDGLELQILATPGHTMDSMSIVLAQDNALLTGDTILGRGTTVVAHPDGALAEYLHSLEVIRELVVSGIDRLFPAHGPVVDDALAVVDFYREHRQQRLEQVRRSVAEGRTTAGEVVEHVYADVGQHLWPAAELSVEAQLLYLRKHG
jgi:glyoxylase-like metal-dependent hydrolase (beta-lactamase superfamily II)